MTVYNGSILSPRALCRHGEQSLALCPCAITILILSIVSILQTYARLQCYEVLTFVVC